jgi:hypothetical protein
MPIVVRSYEYYIYEKSVQGGSWAWTLDSYVTL